jgi:hypothetical protein
VQEDDTSVSLVRECSEVLHVTRDDDEVVLTCVREDIIFIVSSLFECVSDVNGEQVFLIEVVCDFGLMFSSRRNRHSAISGRIRFDAVWSVDGLSERLHRLFPF